MSNYSRKNVRITTTRQPVFSTSRVVSSHQPVVTHRTIRTEPIITQRRTITTEPLVTHRVISSSSADPILLGRNEPIVLGREHYLSSQPLITEHRTVRSQPLITEQRTVRSHTSTPDSTKIIRQMERQLEGELEGRHRDWETQVGAVQQDFFKTGSTAAVLPATKPTEILNINNTKDLFCDTPDGGKVFKVKFDLRDFEPEDIDVKTEFGVLHVLANKVKKNDDGADRSTRRFNRTVELPHNVDPDKMTSSISEDGMLTVEAPVPPEYKDVAKSEAAAEVKIVPSISRTITTETDETGLRLNVPIILGADDVQRTKLVVDLGRGFKPEDITVEAYSLKICIMARREVNENGRISRKGYEREFDFPDPVEPWTTRAKWNENGRLTIAAMNLGYRCGRDEAVEKVLDDLPEEGTMVKVEA